MLLIRTVLTVAALALTVSSQGVGGAQPSRPYTAPEVFTSQLQARTDAGAAATSIRIRIERYMTDVERTRLTDALRHGGYPGFVQALRSGATLGTIEIGGVHADLRWAREQPTERGRTISLVTDKPVYFVGGGRADAKPRAGFELAVVQLSVDAFGFGMGTMAAAAKVKADGQGGVVIEDYADEPIKLTLVSRAIK